MWQIRLSNLICTNNCSKLHSGTRKSGEDFIPRSNKLILHGNYLCFVLNSAWRIITTYALAQYFVTWVSQQKDGLETVQLELEIYLSVWPSHHMYNFIVTYSTFLVLAKLPSADVGIAVRRRTQHKILMLSSLSYHQQMTVVTKYMPEC